VRRKAHLAAAVIVAGAVASRAWAQESPEAGRTSVEAGLSYESLTRGFAPWRGAYLQFVKRGAQRKAIYLAIDETERFSLRDTQFTAGTYHPLNKRWTALFEGTISPTHNVLGKWSALGQIEHDLGGGWGTAVGIRHRQYNTASVSVGNFGLEKYLNPFRAAYTLYASRLAGAGVATAHRVEANYYYGNSVVNFNASYGSELENIPPAGILRTTVTQMSIGGTQWFNDRWGLSYTGSWHKQGRTYTRQGIALGVRRKL
jgi:YaiO family outer membrane protein